MDKTLSFLTKDLIDRATIKIDNEGIPKKREGTVYSVSIKNKNYPFKLLITEAAKIANVKITSNDFASNKSNRDGFEEKTGYKIIETKKKLEFKNLKDLVNIINKDLETSAELGEDIDDKKSNSHQTENKKITQDTGEIISKKQEKEEVNLSEEVVDNIEEQKDLSSKEKISIKQQISEKAAYRNKNNEAIEESETAENDITKTPVIQEEKISVPKIITPKSVDKITAFIYESELEYISRCILDSPNRETGGDLFGFFSHSYAPIIYYAIGPGPKSNRTVAFFQQDIEFLSINGNILNKLFALQHLGNWHSHHRLGLDRPSGHDSGTMFKAIHDNNLKRFLLIIGTIKNQGSVINGFLYDNENNMKEVEWIVIPGISPIRTVVNENFPKELIYTPVVKKAKIVGLKTYNTTNNLQNTWLDSQDRKEFLTSILKEFNSSQYVPKIRQYKDEYLKLIFDEGEVVFPKNFPKEPEKYNFKNKDVYEWVKYIISNYKKI